MEPLPIADDLVLCENALFIPSQKTLIIADLQLGYEEQLRSLGHNIMYEQATQMLQLLERLIEQTGATHLVINGDLKHEFGRVSGQERYDIMTLLERLKRRVTLDVVKGNHDTLTKSLTDQLNVTLLPAWSAAGVYALHGHQLPKEDDPHFKAAHTVVIGHLHPAVTLNDGVRSERYKCFLVGKYERKRLIVLPSFSTIVEGTDVLTGSSHSPLVTERTIAAASVYVLEDEIRAFGTVAKLRRVLKM